MDSIWMAIAPGPRGTRVIAMHGASETLVEAPTGSLALSAADLVSFGLIHVGEGVPEVLPARAIPGGTRRERVGRVNAEQFAQQVLQHRLGAHRLGQGTLVGGQAEKTGVARPHPQLSFMINQKVVQKIVGQTFVLRIASCASVGPTAIKSIRRRNPGE